ncbi:MAG: hypothetical protein JNK82_38255 [Myxococcaceae bacterium]|nr:hypothetical protein [Myxococcaceae bacterium]
MSDPRGAALHAMHASIADDFLKGAGVETPVPDVPGVIPAVGRRLYPAHELKRLVDLLMVYRIGDFEGACSAALDPRSPWYNVSYGAWGLRSHKPGGAAWGFGADGKPDFEEMFEIVALDFNFLKAGALGCPAEQLCFHVESMTPGQSGPWATAEVLATIPSVLHAGLSTPLYGTAEPSFSAGRKNFEPVAMVGQMFFRQVQPRLTLAWGGLAPATPAGEELLEKIVSGMSRLYL